MHYYKLYGFGISSSRRIELLHEVEPVDTVDLNVDWVESTDKTPDNAFAWKEVHSEMLKLYEIITLWECSNSESVISKVCFELQNGRKLNFVINSAEKALSIYFHSYESRSDLESYLVGPAMGIVMRLRGIVCLHSSVVTIDGKAIALVGHSTAGKSTLAAGLAESGAKIMADDIAAISMHEEQFFVHPGYSKVRLRPIAADFLTEDTESLPIVYSGRDSRYVDLAEERSYREEALPLAAIYILGEYSDEFMEPFIMDVESTDKLIRLLQNTYGSYVVMDELRANEFKVLSGIARDIPVRKLFYAHAIETLPKQCEIILKDFRSLYAQSRIKAV